MRLYWSRIGSKPVTGVPLGIGKFGYRRTHTEEGQVERWVGRIPLTMEAEIGVMHLQAKRCQGLWATLETRKRQGMILFWSVEKEHGLSSTLI